RDSSRDPVHDQAISIDLHLPFDPLAEALGHALRALVERVDEADDVLAIQDRERVLECRTRRFRGVASPPKLTSDGPSQLELRPSLGRMKPDAADELVG